MTLKLWLRIAIAGAVGVYGAIFILQNGDRVRVIPWPFGSGYEAPVWLVTAVALALGAVATAVASSVALWRLGAQSRRDARRISTLERELHGLRTLPLEAPKLDSGTPDPSKRDVSPPIASPPIG